MTFDDFTPEEIAQNDLARADAIMWLADIALRSATDNEREFVEGAAQIAALEYLMAQTALGTN